MGEHCVLATNFEDNGGSISDSTYTLLLCNALGTPIDSKQVGKKYTQGFVAPDSFHSTSLATWGSSWGSKEAKFMKEFDFLGFSHCFSAKN